MIEDVNYKAIVWQLIPTESPLVIQHCPRCEDNKMFRCLDKFRINGNQSRVDIWLIYKCTVCNHTWKLTIYRRILPSEISPNLYDKFQNNDRETAWKYAFDIQLLRMCGVEPKPNTPYEVEGLSLSKLSDFHGKVQVHIDFKFQLNPRLDTLLSKQLGITRSQVKILMKSGAVSLFEPSQGKLPKRLLHPIVLSFNFEKIFSVLEK